MNSKRKSIRNILTVIAAAAFVVALSLSALADTKGPAGDAAAQSSVQEQAPAGDSQTPSLGDQMTGPEPQTSPAPAANMPTDADAAGTAQGASTDTADTTASGKAMAAALCVGLAAAAGAIGMGMAIAKSSESISRQPEASGDIRTTLMLGLVFIETAIIYGLIIAILIIFVL